MSYVLAAIGICLLFSWGYLYLQVIKLRYRDNKNLELLLSMYGDMLPPMPLFKGRSGEWPTVREKYIKRYPQCAVCGKEDDLDVHHIIPFHIDPAGELDERNFITLCRIHHFWFGHLGSWHSYNPSVMTDAGNWAFKIQNRP